MSSAPEHSAETGAGAGGGGGGPLGGADPGVLGVIAELQGKLSALGKAHEDKLKRDQAALTERIQQAGAIEQQLAAQRAKLDDEAVKLRERIAAADAEQAKAQELAAAVEGANKQLAQRETGLAQRESVLTRRETEVGERETKLKAAEVQAKDRDRKSQEAAARSAAAHAEAANEAAARASEAVAATERAEAAEAELERLRAELDGSGRTVSEESRALKAQLEATAARADQASAQAEAAKAEAANLRDQLANAKSAAATSQSGDEALLASAVELESRVAGLHEQVAKRDQAIELLRDKLADVTARAGQSQGDGADDGRGPSSAVRRRRLSRYRQLVQNEARKIVAAKDVLSKRQAECESVIAQRAKLVQQAQALAHREAKMHSRRSVVEATAAVCFAMGAVLLVAALSWGAVSQIFPATYIASSVVSAESRGGGREPDLAAWQAYHEALVNDPRLMEEGAERMARRGIESLAKAPALTARLKTDLMLTSDHPGMLRLELRGQGAERTARELETFATALVAMANAARESRADGAGTAQTQPSTSGNEPVKDERFMYTAGFTAGGTGLAAIIGLLAWTQLTRAKRRYEAAGIHDE